MRHLYLYVASELHARVEKAATATGMNIAPWLRHMVRLDDPSQTKLQQLVKQFGASKAEVIRQLIAQAELEDFPPSWHMKAAERRAP